MTANRASMPLSHRKLIVLLSFVVGCLSVLAGCSFGDLLETTKWSDGTYEVYRIQLQPELWIKLEDGGGIGRVGEKVVAVGSDDQFVVAKQEDIENNDLEQYFYIVKADDDTFLNADEIVQGPFTKSEFDVLVEELNLPPFSKEF